MTDSRKPFLLALVGATALLPLTACTRSSNACPRALQGKLPNTQATLNTSPPITAKFVELHFECLPIKSPAIETDKLKVPASTAYEIAVTADVAFTLPEQTTASQRSSLAGTPVNVSLEAVSDSGVVLRSANTRVLYVPGGLSSRASGRITGMTEEEVTRVRTVRVGW